MTGNILLTFGLVASFFTMLMYYFTWKGYKNTLTYARVGYYLTTFAVVGASIILLYAILDHNFIYKYVFNYSGDDLPWGLLLSTFYAGQEGSFLLWLLFTVLVGLFLLDFTAKRGDLEPRVMIPFTLTATFLLVMVSPALKSPFSYLWTEDAFVNIKYVNQMYLSLPFIGKYIFQDPNSGNNFVKISEEFVNTLAANGVNISDFVIKGKGLNPLLQNFWMQIHPPILFVGFAMTSVPFAFGIAALVKNDYSSWIKHSLPWLLVGMMVLGLAIMMGGYWAYGVLGWGGYWGWDPVENSSLVPWIIGVAAIHTMLIQRKYPQRFVKTNLILAVLTYILVMYSTFLTRSGILSDASVHSFVAPGKIVFTFLLGFMILFTTIGIGGVLYRWKYLSANFHHEENFYSRELALFTGAFVLIASAINILGGTSAPIFGLATEIRFYNQWNLPIAIIIGLINGLSLLLKWKQTNGKLLLKDSIVSLALAGILTVGVIIFGEVYDVMMIIFTYSTAFALFVNMEVAFKIIKGKLSFLGAYIAHAGIALFFLGVIATGAYTSSETFELPKEQVVSKLGYDFKFLGYRLIEGGKKYSFDVEVKRGTNTTVVSPVMYIAEFNNSLMREPDILNYFTRDLYIEPKSYDEGKGSAGGSSDQIKIKKGETLEHNGLTLNFTAFDISQMGKMQSGEPFSIWAILTVSKGDISEEVKLEMKSTGSAREFVPLHLHNLEVDLQLTALDASGVIGVAVKSNDHGNSTEQQAKAAPTRDVLSVEASIKPFINLVWAGVIVMTIGFFFAAFRRFRESVK